MSDQAIPDVYGEVYDVKVSPNGAVVNLGRASADALMHLEKYIKDGAAQIPLERVGTFRIPLHQWKIMLMTGRRQLKEHETKFGEVAVPKPDMEMLKLTPADW